MTAIAITLFPTLLFAQLRPGACPDGKTYKVALTLDDGPNPIYTPKILDVLKRQNVKATFFVLGERFESGSRVPYQLLDRIKAEGHLIGSHTQVHHAHTKLSPAEAKKNIERPKDLIGSYLSPILRLPYGDGSFKSRDPDKQKKNDTVMSLVKNAGYEHVGWDIDTNDWDPQQRRLMPGSMLKEICDQEGGIVLMHDIQSNTAANIESWIKAIRAAGHEIVGLENFVPRLAKTAPPRIIATPIHQEGH